MEVLLVAVNAKYIHSNLAVYSLHAYAKKCGYDTTICEYTINQTTDYVIREIYKKKPDILCFSCYIWNISFVEELIRELHKLLPDTEIWVGGPEVSYEAESFLENHNQVSLVMIGEGEQTFVEQLERKKEKRDVEGSQKGVACKKDGIYLPPLPQQGMNMDDIPFPYENMKDFENRIIYYESSRGCPFRCSYCLSSIEKSLRFRSISLVKKELQFFIDQKVPQVKFVDRTFNCKHDHAMAIWQFIKDADLGVTNFHFEISADLLTDEEIAFLNTLRPGLVQLEIGVQSTNEKTIHEIRRTMNLKRLKETTFGIHEGENIHQHLDLIAGLPYEDIETFKKSFDDIYAWKPNQLQMGFLKVLKGSYMYENKEAYGLVYKDTPQYEILKTNWLSFEDVIRLKRIEEMLEVYYNSGQFQITMMALETAYESAFLMFDALGNFYEKNDYFRMKFNRNQRAQILLDFVMETGVIEEDLAKEALTFDIYYRENAKSRPAFASEYQVEKEMERAKAGKGKLRHLEQFTYRFWDKHTIYIKEKPKKTEPYYILFDYEHRDPLDHQAQITILEKKNEQTDEGNS